MAGYWPRSSVCIFMDLHFVSVHNNAKKELGEYPAILTSRLFNNAYILLILLYLNTISYGDRVPISAPARIFAISCIAVGLIVVGFLMSAITTAITFSVIEVQTSLYGSKVAAISGTPEHFFALRKNARVNEEGNYTTFEEIYDALLEGKVDGILMDTYELGSKKDIMNHPSIKIQRIYDYKSTYGLVLAGKSTKLWTCSQGFMKSNKANLFRTIEALTDVIEETPVSKQKEILTGLFDPNSDTFWKFVSYCLTTVGIAMALGVIWDLQRRYRGKSKVDQVSEMERHKIYLKTEMNNFVRDFCKQLENKLRTMALQHKQQLKCLMSNITDKRKIKANRTDSLKTCSLLESPENSASLTRNAKVNSSFCAAKYSLDTTFDTKC